MSAPNRRSFLLQLAGWPGSGKSSLARVLAPRTGAAVLDHDTTKSALLDVAIDARQAGPASYEVVFALAADLLDQGLPVIIDSPSAWRDIPRRELRLADQRAVPYHFIECDCPEDVAADRLRARRARPSQVRDADGAAHLRRAGDRRPWRPERGVLTLDTTQPIEVCVQHALGYLAGPGASGPVCVG